MSVPIPLNLYRTILDRVCDAIYLLNGDGQVVYWNQACEDLTGLKVGDVLYANCEQVNDCLQTNYTQRSFDEGKAGPLGEETLPEPMERVIRHVGGRLVPVVARHVSAVDPETRMLYMGEIIQDVSNLRQMERKSRGIINRYERIVREQQQGISLIGKNEAMAAIFTQIEQAAMSDAAILVLGESGTGKELVADSIHCMSPRSEKPLIKVNCSAIPEALLESELFGHTKGAFTGAHQDKVGRFEAAEGGTLFLDEIGDLSPVIQVKLLRFLQEKTFERVGEATTRQANVRIVSATNADLLKNIRDGKFREDLYYRLRVFPIRLPALRERRDDVPHLVAHFLDRFSRKTNKTIHALSHGAMEVMVNHDWPGNVRELENAIEYAFVVCQSDVVSESDLPPEMLNPPEEEKASPPLLSSHSSIVPAPSHPKSVSPQAPVSPEPELAAWEMVKRLKDPDYDRQVLVETLNAVRWNRAKAAERLGCSRMTIWKKMKKYHCHPVT